MAELCKTWPNEYDVLVDGGGDRTGVGMARQLVSEGRE